MNRTLGTIIAASAALLLTGWACAKDQVESQAPTPEEVSNQYTGILKSFGEPCQGLAERKLDLNSLVAITGFMYAKQQLAGMRPTRNEYSESLSMVEAVEVECKPGMLITDAANSAAKRAYKTKAKVQPKITTAPELALLSHTCGTVVNLGGSIRPDMQLAREVGGLAAFMAGYSVAFGHKDAVPISRLTEAACVQMQSMRFADVWLMALMNK